MAKRKSNKVSKPVANKLPVFTNNGEVVDMDGYVKSATYNITASPNNVNKVGNAGDDEIVKVIDRIFSTDDIDQKTYLNHHQIEGLIELEAFLSYDANTYGFIDRVQYCIDRNVVIKNKSLLGFGLTKLVEMFRELNDAVNQKMRANNGDLRLIK